MIKDEVSSTAAQREYWVLGAVGLVGVVVGILMIEGVLPNERAGTALLITAGGLVGMGFTNRKMTVTVTEKAITYQSFHFRVVPWKDVKAASTSQDGNQTRATIWTESTALFGRGKLQPVSLHVSPAVGQAIAAEAISRGVPEDPAAPAAHTQEEPR